MIRKLILFGILAILLLGTLALGENAKASEAGQALSRMNESDYLNFSSSIWRLYRDDLNYSSYILEGFDLVSKSSALNCYVNIFNIYSRFWTNTASI